MEEWQRRSDALEQERDDALEDRDRYLERYQSANGEVESLRKAGRGHSARVSAFQQQERTQSAEIRRLQGENKLLQAEPASLQGELKEKNTYIESLKTMNKHVRKNGPRMVLLSAGAGAMACIFWCRSVRACPSAGGADSTGELTTVGIAPSAIPS